jgi:hypothetical protein
MNYMTTFGGFQVKIFMANCGYTARRSCSVIHCQSNRVIEVYDGFMLDISDLGTVVDMVFAVTVMFCDRIRVLLPGGGITCSFTLIPNILSISPEFMNKSQTGDIQRLSIGSYLITNILHPFF